MHLVRQDFTRCVLVLVTAIGNACSTTTDPDRDGGIKPAPLFRTDSTTYTLRSNEFGYEGRIGVTFKNETTTTANFVNCSGATAVELQKLVADKWTSVWSPILPACLSSPIAVMPADTRQFTIQIFGGYPGSKFYPQFSITDIAGVYRTVWTAVVTDYQDRSPPFGNPLPLEHRVSNQFMISVEPR